mgnify:CR=1 FL=1
MSKQKPHQLLETIVQQIPGENYPEVHAAVTQLRQFLAPKVSETGKQKGRPPMKSIHGPTVAWYVLAIAKFLKAKRYPKPKMTAYALVSLKFEIDIRRTRKLTGDFKDEAAEPSFSSKMWALLDHPSSRGKIANRSNLPTLNAEVIRLLSYHKYNKSHD